MKGIMKTKLNSSSLLLASLYLIATLGLAVPAGVLAGTNSGYIQVNLVSDISTNAPHTDGRLVNPWGIVAGDDVLGVNDNGTGLVTAYGPFGRTAGFAIHVPAPPSSGGGTLTALAVTAEAAGTGKPTGLVLNETGAFV